MESNNWSERVQGIKGLDAGRELRFTDKVLNQVTESIKLSNDDNILEVGCGPGSLTRKIAKKFINSKVVGMDMDPYFIDYCKEQADSQGINNVEYQIGDALELPYKDNSFDICTSHTVIEHVENSKFLLEQYRVCKPSGYVSVLYARPELTLNTKNTEIT